MILEKSLGTSNAILICVPATNGKRTPVTPVNWVADVPVYVTICHHRYKLPDVGKSVVVESNSVAPIEVTAESDVVITLL